MERKRNGAGNTMRRRMRLSPWTTSNLTLCPTVNQTVSSNLMQRAIFRNVLRADFTALEKLENHQLAHWARRLVLPTFCRRCRFVDRYLQFAVSIRAKALMCRE